MKKYIKLFAYVFIFSLILSGCGDKADDTVTDNVKDEIAGEQDVSITGSQTSEDTQDTTETSEENIAIKSQELFTFEGLTVTIKDVTYEELWNEGIAVTLKNTGDVKYKVVSERIDFNGYTYSTHFRETVPAGETVESVLRASVLPDFFGAEEVGQVSVHMQVKETVLAKTIYESGEILLKTSKYDEFPIVKQDNGDVIYEAGDIRIVSLGLVLDEENNYRLRLFVENNRNEPIVVDCSKANVNDYEIETLFHPYANPGKMNVSELVFYSQMQSYGITEIEELEICFTIQNPDSWELIDNSDIISVPVKMAE